jgi:indoleamine 2,3-dioxygenase
MSDAKLDELWQPGPHNGFLPMEVPASPVDVAAGQNGAMVIIGEKSPSLADMSPDEIDALVAELGANPDIDIPSLPPTLIEATLRCYVSLAAHLIHRPEFTGRKSLPPAVAKPLWELSEAVGRPPSLTYASYVLSNFTTHVGASTCPADLVIGQTPSGTHDEEWFVAVHLAIESVGGTVVAAATDIDRALAEDDYDAIEAAIDSVGTCLEFAVRTMPTVRERLDPETFRTDIRPLLYGHDEITFHGVSGEPRVAYIGETGAQSGVIRAADAVLGTPHTQAMVASMDRFLACAPPTHQRYLAEVAAVGRRLNDADLPAPVSAARRAALATLASFRRTHLGVVMDYLAPEGTTLAERGTGGTYFQVWLQRLIDETEMAMKTA